MTPIDVRALVRADLSHVAHVLDATGLFPSAMLAEMAEPFLSGAAPHHWLVAAQGDRRLGFAYAEPERMTDGTANLLAIAVDPASQSRGVGKALVSALAARLKAQGNRVLLVETSSFDDYAGARAFYAGQGFVEEARIRDFYQAGEDKIIFWRRL